MLRALALTGALVSTLVPQVVEACDGARPWVRVILEESWDESELSVLRDLRAELAVLHMDACTDGPDGKVPLAEVLLGRAAAVATVEIEIQDAVTHKYVGRSVPLDAVPEAARSLTVALAVVELLRASWIELRLQSASEPTAPVPEEVEQAVEGDVIRPPPEPPAPPANALSLLGVGELALGGLGQAGGEVRYERWLFGPLSVALGAGARYGFPFDSSQGSVDARAFAGTVLLRLGLTSRRTPFTVGLEAGVGVLFLRFAGTPRAGFIAEERSDVAVSLRLGAYGRAQLVGPLAIDASFGVGVPVVGVVATDSTGAPLGGVTGVELLGTLGPSVVF